MKSSKLIFALSSLLLIFSCGSDDAIDLNDDVIQPILADEVEVYEADLLHTGVVLGIENGQATAYILNKEGEKLHTWNLADRLGNDFELMHDGRALGAFKVSNPPFSFGGGAGSAKIINPDSSIDWEFTLADNDFLIHHDVEPLPNGNVLMMVWERIEKSVAQQEGINTMFDIFPEKLIEVNPTTDQVVWEWRSWDRRIQDQNATLPNFGVVSDSPERIDFNYNTDIDDTGDIMHANGIDYDAENDVIYMSVNFYSEIWVIDHGTTTQEAATNSGGNFGKGGDLLYRFGNPEAYKNTAGQRRFFNNHFPNLLEGNEPGAGNLLVYVNQGANDLEQSTVYELAMPNTFDLQPNTDNEPAVIWSFTDSNMYFGRVSGAVRLNNGNTLICEGDYGFWEVTANGEIVWKYNGASNYWRGYSYELNDPALSNLGLSF